MLAVSLRTALFMQAGGSCPVEVSEVIRGWGQYVGEDSTHFKEIFESLPTDERQKVSKLADLVVTSFTAVGCPPLGRITVVGHADKDFHGAKKERKVSEGRALTIQFALARAIVDLAKKRGVGPFVQGAIAFDPPPRGVGATEPDPEALARRDRTLNRRVVVTLTPRGAPVPPPPPDPTIETTQRLDRALALINKRGMPNGQVQTDRVKCILDKLRNNPNVKDRFVDGDLPLVRIRGKLVNGLQEINRNYGSLTQEEREAFFEKAKVVVLSVPQFGKAATDDEVIGAANGLDLQILKAQGFLDAHLGLNGIASDNTKVVLNDEITRLQNDPNSIYNCK